MEDQKKEGIQTEIYSEYFKQELEDLERVARETDRYSEIISKQVEMLHKSASMNAKGSQHYLVEHIKNAVSLQSQKQSLLKDRMSLKKIILDYSIKEAKGDQDVDLMTSINQYISMLKDQQNGVKEEMAKTADALSADDIDEQIDSILEGNDNA